MTSARTRVTLGIDVGTSSTKGMLVTTDGTVLRGAARHHEPQRPRPGHVEMDAEIWWRELIDLSAELTAPGDVEVIGIGATGMGPCVLPADEAGAPLHPAILYGVDTRAAAQIAELETRFGAESILERSGCLLSSQAAGPKLLWLREEHPELVEQGTRFFMTSSFLVHRLTGEHVLDRPSASQCTPFWDAAAQDWDRERAHEVLPGLELPRLMDPGDLAGTVTPEAAAQLPGVPAGIPVAAGTIDAWAEAVGAGADHPGDLMIMYGTTMFLIATSERPARSRTLWASAGIRTGEHMMTGGTATSGAITSWLQGVVGSDDHGALLEEAAASGPGANGLLMLPYFAGERSPVMDPEARGVVVGLTLSHTRGDLHRAALEAAALSVRHHLDEMDAAGAGFSRAVAVGGGTRGGLWPQIVSDVTGLAQELPSCTEDAPYGGARMAAQLAGVEGTEAWNPIERVVTPDPGPRARYDELYGLYLDLYPRTREVAHALARMQTETKRQKDG